MRPIQPLAEIDTSFPSYFMPPRIEESVLVPKPSPNRNSHIAHGLSIDAVQMAQDKDYFLKTILYIHAKARQHYNNFQYAIAQDLYKMFFQYLKLYRPHYPVAPPINFYPAMFEYAWILQLQGEKKEAQKQLNQELIKLLEPIKASKEPRLEEVRESVNRLEEKGLLPTPDRTDIRVSAEDLIELAQLHARYGQYPPAIQLLRHAEVLQMLEFHTARALEKKFEHDQEHPIAETSSALHHGHPYIMKPFGYSYFGVPVSPILPITPEDAKSIQTKTIKPEYHVERVEPFASIGKDLTRNRSR